MSQENSAAPEMEGVVIACVQMEPHVGAKHDNVTRAVRYIEAAAEHGAALIVLPELSNSGYVFADRDEAMSLAETLPDGETARAFGEAARRLGVHIVAGIAEREGGHLYNSALLTGPAGPIGVYRKLHLWNNEKRFFEPGDYGVPVFDTPLGRLAIAICYDGWFPETYRLAAMQGADIVCVPTNWVPIPGQDPNREAMANILCMAAAHSTKPSSRCRASPSPASLRKYIHHRANSRQSPPPPTSSRSRSQPVSRTTTCRATLAARTHSPSTMIVNRP